MLSTVREQVSESNSNKYYTCEIVRASDRASAAAVYVLFQRNGALNVKVIGMLAGHLQP